MYEFRLPDIGEGIHEAQIVEWRVQVGQRVEEEDPLVVVSTDKVDVELPAPRAGVIQALHGAVGEIVEVGTVIVRIRTAGGAEDAGAGAGEEAPAGVDPGTARMPPHPQLAEDYVVLVEGDVGADRGRIRATPVTRKFAATHGIDLGTVTGSGPRGRILRRDVEAALAAARPAGDAATARTASAPPAAAAPPAASSTAAPRRERLLGGRAVAAERLSESLRTRAHSTLAFEVAGDGLRYLVEQLRPEAERRGTRLTPLALVLKCVARTLETHPRLNATVDDSTGELLLHEAAHIGVAVDREAGLVVPVIRDVGARDLLGLAAAIATAAERARAGALLPGDVSGGTFTVSSTGGLERARLLAATPIINVPQVAILWVSRVADRPRVVDGRLEAGPMLACSLAFDHRWIDGAEATRFINDLTAFLEAPARVMV